MSTPSLIILGAEDKRSWEWESNEVFSASSYYGILAEGIAEKTLQFHEFLANFPRRRIYDTPSPFRVGFFA